MSKETARAMKAYETYAAMGPSRSLAKLVRALSTSNPTSLSGLKAMSKRHGWQERIRAYDEQVAANVQEKAIAQEVEKRVDALGAVDTLILFCGGMLDQLVKATPLAIHTPQDLRAVATSLDVAAKLKELLEGRATARTDNMTVDEVKAKLAAALTERAELLSADQLDHEIEALTKRRDEKLGAGAGTMH